MPPAPEDVDIPLVIPELLNPLALLPRELDMAPVPDEREVFGRLVGAPVRESVEPVEFRAWRKPMFESAFPFANGPLVFCLLQQLQPVNSMPIAHAPIRFA